MKAILPAFVAVVFAVTACTSIDSVKDKKLDLCKTITDEALRVRCITAVK